MIMGQPRAAGASWHCTMTAAVMVSSRLRHKWPGRARCPRRPATVAPAPPRARPGPGLRRTAGLGVSARHDRDRGLLVVPLHALGYLGSGHVARDLRKSQITARRNGIHQLGDDRTRLVIIIRGCCVSFTSPHRPNLASIFKSCHLARHRETAESRWLPR
jgi:hypothetical protein